MTAPSSSRRVAANAQTIRDDRAFQVYVDQMQELLMDAHGEMHFVARGIGKRLRKSPPNHSATGTQVAVAAYSVRRDLRKAAGHLAAASALIARADTVHTEMFLAKKRDNRNQNNGQPRGNGQPRNNNNQNTNGRRRQDNGRSRPAA